MARSPKSSFQAFGKNMYEFVYQTLLYVPLIPSYLIWSP